MQSFRTDILCAFQLVRSRYKKTLSTSSISAPIPLADSPTRGYEALSPVSPNSIYDPSFDDTFAAPGKHNRDSTASLEAVRKKAKTSPYEEAEPLDDGNDGDIGRRRDGGKGSVGRRLAKPRKSRFIEGSMKDRASERPRPELIGMDEKGMLNSGAGGAGGEDVEMKSPERKEEFTVGGLVTSVFTFRAKSYCKETWWNPRKAKFEEMEKKRREKEEQKKRAEEKYFEMKRKGTLFSNVNNLRSEDTMPMDIDKESQIGRAVSTDDIVPAEIFSPPADTTSFSPGLHPASQTDGSDGEYLPSTGKSTRRLSKQPKDAAMTLKKRASRLFSPKTNSISGPVITSPPPANNGTMSKKELQKQQKLIKKYSDLEDKLSKARRELAEAGIEPPPLPPLPQDVVNRFSVGKVPMTAPPPFTEEKPSTSNINLTENDKPVSASPLATTKPTSPIAPSPLQDSQLPNLLPNPSQNFSNPKSSNASINMPAPPTPVVSSVRSRHGSVRSRKGSLKGRHIRSISGGSSRTGSPPPPARDEETPEMPRREDVVMTSV